MYWADWSSNDIWRANLDGSGKEILVHGLASPITITLDLTAVVDASVVVEQVEVEQIEVPDGKIVIPLEPVPVGDDQVARPGREVDGVGDVVIVDETLVGWQFGASGLIYARDGHGWSIMPKLKILSNEWLSNALMDTSYLRIATLITILENIFGHPSNCSNAPTCPTCKKKWSHRAGSERDWRRQFIDGLNMTEEAKDQYSKIIEEAYAEVRHPTVHAGRLPTACFRFPKESGTEVYNTERTIEQYRSNSTALLNLVVSTTTITRYLLLHRLFNVAFFKPLAPMHSFTSISPPPQVSNPGT
jgi:hypothetical protein